MMVSPSSCLLGLEGEPVDENTHQELTKTFYSLVLSSMCWSGCELLTQEDRTFYGLSID